MTKVICNGDCERMIHLTVTYQSPRSTRVFKVDVLRLGKTYKPTKATLLWMTRDAAKAMRREMRKPLPK